MTTMIVLNIVISLIGIGLVTAMIRVGYRIGGGAFERPSRVAELPRESRELERAA